MFLKVLDNLRNPGERLVETLGKLQASGPPHAHITFAL